MLLASVLFVWLLIGVLVLALRSDSNDEYNAHLAEALVGAYG